MFRLVTGLGILLCLGCLPLTAGEPGSARALGTEEETRPHVRLLTPDEGLAIVNAAREYGERRRRNIDCSHLVHKIYGRAGFTYPYASSFSLYAGGENFRRVKTPQAGDLIVWRGHVGIVVDPARHSFYSSRGSGLGIDSYGSGYWLQRGSARLYRYVLRGRGSMDVMATRTPPETPEATIQVAAMPAAERNDEAPVSAAQPSDRRDPQAARALVVPSVSSPNGGAPRIPASVAINPQGRRPTSAEIEEAISELGHITEDALRRGNSSKPPLPLTVYSGLGIGRLKIKGKVGSVQVRVDSIASIDGDQINLKSHHTKTLWKLRRAESGWLVDAPVDRIYLARQVAARLFAEELVRMTRRSPDDSQGGTLIRQEAQLTRVLGALFRED